MIDINLLFEQLEFKPHSKEQWDYCTSEVRFNIPCCGRRWGKSIATGHRITYKLFKPDQYIWIVGPNYRLGEKEFRVVYNDIKKLGILSKCRKTYNAKQGDMRIQLPWNSVVEVVSAERPDSLVGEGLDHVCMSESALHSRVIWDQFIEPALSDKLGTADFPSTPRGYNWYYGLWELGQDPEFTDYKAWSLPTWTNSVRFPGGIDNPEIQRIKSIVSQQHFDQEYAAKFTTFVGQIYEEFNPTIHVRQIPYNPAFQNFMTFDFGFANPFVCLDIMVDVSDNVYVWREYYLRNMSTYEHGQKLLHRPQPDGYHCDAMYGDPRGANEIATLALILGHIQGTPTPWKHGVESIKRALKLQPDGEPKLFIDSSCINLIREMEQLHIDEKIAKDKIVNEHQGDGNIQHKRDDHAADALRYFFSEYFVSGIGTHLSDVYNPPGFAGSEAADFLTLRKGVTLDSMVSL